MYFILFWGVYHMAQFHNYIEVCVAVSLHATAEYPMTAPSLEQLYDLPLRKTELLIRHLVRANIIQSVRGHHGGYYITKPENISLAKVYDVFLAHQPKVKTIFDRLKQPISELLSQRTKQYRSDLKNIRLGEILSQYDKTELPKREFNNFVYYI